MADANATSTPARTAGMIAFALVCFAGNSLLCRGALRPHAIDPASFTLARMVSGALVLAALHRLRAGATPAGARARDLASPFALFVYAIAFSFAYVRLTAGTGALVLFGVVQVTMLSAAVRAGERPKPMAWFGIALAVAGLVGLTFPGLDAPDPFGATLMAIAGVSWAAYTLRGRGATDPLGATARNFSWSVPMAAIVWMANGKLGPPAHAEPLGLVLAAASGGVASGIGYAVWYAALPSLAATRAAVLQLAVPVITAAIAVAALGEEVTMRWFASSVAVVGGIGLVLRRR